MDQVVVDEAGTLSLPETDSNATFADLVDSITICPQCEMAHSRGMALFYQSMFASLPNFVISKHTKL
eukprot:scaffold92487_cov37-Prasinocladus_malaysianus.AAC.1